MAMRGVISAAIPAAAPARKLHVLSRLLHLMAQGDWGRLADIAAMMARSGAELDPSIQAMLGELAGQTAAEARYREPTVAARGA